MLLMATGQQSQVWGKGHLEVR